MWYWRSSVLVTWNGIKGLLWNDKLHLNWGTLLLKDEARLCHWIKCFRVEKPLNDDIISILDDTITTKVHKERSKSLLVKPFNGVLVSVTSMIIVGMLIFSMIYIKHPLDLAQKFRYFGVIWRKTSSGYSTSHWNQ